MPQATNIMLSADNRLLMAGVTVTASSEASSSMGAANLVNRDPNKRHRTTGVTSEWFRFQSATPFAIRTVEVHRHNYSLTAQWQVETGGAVGVLDEDSGLMDVWRGVYGYGEAPYGLYPYGGYPEADLRPWIPARYDAGIRIVRDLKITVTDPDNTDGYLTQGLVFATVPVQPQRNVQFGFSSHWPSAATQIPVDGGGVRVVRRTPFKTLDLTLMLTRAEAYSTVDDLVRRVAQGDYMSVSPFPGAAHPISVRCEIYGPAAITQPPRLIHFDVVTMGLQVRSA